jgi:hypothetical protein
VLRTPLPSVGYACAVALRTIRWILDAARENDKKWAANDNERAVNDKEGCAPLQNTKSMEIL